MRIKILLLSFVVTFLVGLSASAQTGKTLDLAVSDGASPVVNAYLQLLQQAYAEIGYDVKMVRYPLKRTYYNANIGKSDGLLIASGTVVKTFSQLVAVPEPLTHINLMVYAIDKEFQVAGPKSISLFKVGILRGYPLSEKLTQGMDRQVLNSYKSLFSVLKVGRVDIVLAMQRETTRFLKENSGYENIKTLEPPLFRLPLFHILNAKHKELIPKITPIIKRKLAEGVLQELYKPYAN